MLKRLNNSNKNKKKADNKMQNFNKNMIFYKRNTKKLCSSIKQNLTNKKSS